MINNTDPLASGVYERIEWIEEEDLSFGIAAFDPGETTGWVYAQCGLIFGRPVLLSGSVVYGQIETD